MRSSARNIGLTVALGLLLPCAAHAAFPPQASHGRFQQVAVQGPDSAVQRVVLWFHGAGQASAAQREREALRDDGALVVAVDMGQLRAALEREGSRRCGFGAGDVENFSRWLQAWLRLPGYRLPLIAGDGEGAGFAYQLVAQAGPGVFAGLLTLGWDAGPASGEPMVCGKGSRDGVPEVSALAMPWLAAGDAARIGGGQHGMAYARRVALTARGDAVPGLRAAARVMGDAQGVSVAPAPKALDGLPIVEVPAAQRGDTLAIFLSGDGGWAGLDKEVAAHLADHGVAVVGLDSLRYFWSARTPSGVADDLVRIADHYRQRWQRPRLLLIGFSQGADVLPASINQMTPAMRSRIALVALMSLGRRAEFEFHVSNWLGSSDQGLPIAPEVARLPQDRTLCLYGLKDADALCPGLPPGGIRVLPLPGDHHFDGDHERLAREILAAAAARQP